VAGVVRRVRFDADPNLLGVIGGMASPFVADTTRAVLNRATVLAPKKTGNLANSMQFTMRARRTFIAGRVESRVKYFMPVHDGSAPHRIVARRKKALAFFWPKVGAMTLVPKKRGGTGYAISKGRKGRKGKGKISPGGRIFFIGKGYVNHPGTKARPFLMTALDQVAGGRGFIVVPLGRAAATGDF
jgi:hypothetical protein